jgi:hypothetical protein
MNMIFSGVAGSRPARGCPVADGDGKRTVKGEGTGGGTLNTVIAGLDPAIHLLRKTLAKMDGCAGQARA